MQRLKKPGTKPVRESYVRNNINHIIFLLLENQSFDRLLGCLRELYPDMEGLNRPGTPPYANSDDQRVYYNQKPTATKQVKKDPKHEARYVLKQLEGNNGGFVLDFVANYPDSSLEERQEIMGYYPLYFLPALHTLAREFTVCDHWFSSLPGPTWPNRFFALTGTCNGQALMPEGWRHPQLATFFNQTQDTIFDRLNEAGRSWKIYYYDFPSSILLAHQRRPENLLRYHHIETFFQDCANEPSFPQFAFIEPKYFGADQNDDHPPHNIVKGEKLIADVYNAIRSSPQLWASSLLVITFDEHGGFYDHVSPPPAVPPDDLPAKVDPEDPSAIFRFDRLGVRVPAVLVSPWVAKRVENTPFDHTSLLKYLTDKWGLGPLGRRTAAATPISVAIRDQLREDTPAFVRVPYTDLIPPDPVLEKDDSSLHHRALHAFAYYLAREAGDLSTADKATREPNAWMRTKAGIGSVLMSAGALLAADFRSLQQEKANETIKIAESLIGGAARTR